MKATLDSLRLLRIMGRLANEDEEEDNIPDCVRAGAYIVNDAFDAVVHLQLRCRCSWSVRRIAPCSGHYHFSADSSAFYYQRLGGALAATAANNTIYSKFCFMGYRHTGHIRRHQTTAPKDKAGAKSPAGRIIVSADYLASKVAAANSP